MAAREMLVRAARRALTDAMTADPRVLVVGEDVVAGGPFTLTENLAEQFGTRRVRNTPISEGAFMGAGIGAALAGGRPFVDIMFNDFVTAASDQLFNHAAKIHFMSGGRTTVPLTVWTLAGANKRWGAQHSQNFASWFAQVPGLKVLSPASPDMAYATVRAALEDPDPVVVLVDRSLLFSRKGLEGDGGSPWDNRVVRPGDDVTLVAAGRCVHLALEAADATGMSVEVIDLQRLAPLDLTVACESAARTGRVLVAYDESGGSLAATVANGITEGVFSSLKGPVARVTSKPTPVPAAGVLEDAQQIDADDISSALQALNGSASMHV